MSRARGVSTSSVHLEIPGKSTEVEDPGAHDLCRAVLHTLPFAALTDKQLLTTSFKMPQRAERHARHVKAGRRFRGQ